MLYSIMSLNAKKSVAIVYKKGAAPFPTQPLVTVKTNVQLPMPISGFCL